MNYSLEHTSPVYIYTNWIHTKFTSNHENPCELSNCQVVSDCKIVTATDMSNKGAGNFWKEGAALRISKLAHLLLIGKKGAIWGHNFLRKYRVKLLF